MASTHIHLAICNRYLEKNKIEDADAFFRGNLDPDLTEDKSISHYTGAEDKNNLRYHLEQKVRLNEFLEQEDIDSDYQRGIFLHLITDYIFFNDFFENEYMNNVTYQDFVKDLYYSYKMIDNYLIDTYNLDFKDYSNKINENIKFYRKKNDVNDNEQRINILPQNKLNEFIERISSIDIYKYRDKIIKNGKNILP